MLIRSSRVEEMLASFRGGQDFGYDPRGNFTVEVKGGRIIARLMHPDTGKELASFEGKNPKELYLRIEATDYEGRKAWTNPIYNSIE